MNSNRRYLDETYTKLGRSSDMIDKTSIKAPAHFTYMDLCRKLQKTKGINYDKY